MVIQCKNCGSAIPASNIDLNRQIAKCDRCNSVFGCRDELSGIIGMSRGEIQLPDGITVKRDLTGLNIERSWFGSRTIVLTICSILWIGFIIQVYGGVLSSGKYQLTLFDAFFVPGWLVSIFLIYAVLTGYINKTRISVSPQSLTIRHGPIPALGNMKINHAEIKQIFSREIVSHNRNGTYSSHDVHATTRSGIDIKLLKDLENREQALYIEQEIERFLHIKNEPVAGEIARRS